MHKILTPTNYILRNFGRTGADTNLKTSEKGSIVLLGGNGAGKSLTMSAFLPVLIAGQLGVSRYFNTFSKIKNVNQKNRNRTDSKKRTIESLILANTGDNKLTNANGQPLTERIAMMAIRMESETRAYTFGVTVEIKNSKLNHQRWFVLSHQPDEHPHIQSYQNDDPKTGKMLSLQEFEAVNKEKFGLDFASFAKDRDYQNYIADEFFGIYDNQDVFLSSYANLIQLMGSNSILSDEIKLKTILDTIRSVAEPVPAEKVKDLLVPLIKERKTSEELRTLTETLDILNKFKINSNLDKLLELVESYGNQSKGFKIDQRNAERNFVAAEAAANKKQAEIDNELPQKIQEQAELVQEVKSQVDEQDEAQAELNNLKNDLSEAKLAHSQFELYEQVNKDIQKLLAKKDAAIQQAEKLHDQETSLGDNIDQIQAEIVEVEPDLQDVAIDDIQALAKQSKKDLTEIKRLNTLLKKYSDEFDRWNNAIDEIQPLISIPAEAEAVVAVLRKYQVESVSQKKNLTDKIQTLTDNIFFDTKERIDFVEEKLALIADVQVDIQDLQRQQQNENDKADTAQADAKDKQTELNNKFGVGVVPASYADEIKDLENQIDDFALPYDDKELRRNYHHAQSLESKAQGALDNARQDLAQLDADKEEALAIKKEAIQALDTFNQNFENDDLVDFQDFVGRSSLTFKMLTSANFQAKDINLKDDDNNWKSVYDLVQRFTNGSNVEKLLKEKHRILRGRITSDGTKLNQLIASKNLTIDPVPDNAANVIDQIEKIQDNLDSVQETDSKDASWDNLRTATTNFVSALTDASSQFTDTLANVEKTMNVPAKKKSIQVKMETNDNIDDEEAFTEAKYLVQEDHTLDEKTEFVRQYLKPILDAADDIEAIPDDPEQIEKIQEKFDYRLWTEINLWISRAAFDTYSPVKPIDVETSSGGETTMLILTPLMTVYDLLQARKTKEDAPRFAIFDEMGAVFDRQNTPAFIELVDRFRLSFFATVPESKEPNIVQSGLPITFYYVNAAHDAKHANSYKKIFDYVDGRIKRVS